MCVRFSPLSAKEAQAVLDMRGGRSSHAIKYIEAPNPLHDARPGSQVPLFVPDSSGSLTVQSLIWVFPLDGKPNVVFNTHIKTALVQLERGRRNMWAKTIREGRCLVPVRAFYESHMTERIPSPVTGKPVRRQHRFRLPSAREFLLATVQLDDIFSIVTTEPNASVTPVHNRMPPILCPGESSVWLGKDFSRLANRSTLRLLPVPE